MTWIIPSGVIQGTTTTGQLTEASSFVNLPAAGSVTLGEFLIDFAPNFDAFVWVVTGAAVGVQVATLQPQVRNAASGSGSTFRNYGNAYNILDSTAFGFPNNIPARLPGFRAQWVLTMNAGVLTTTLEFTLANRS